MNVDTVCISTGEYLKLKKFEESFEYIGDNDRFFEYNWADPLRMKVYSSNEFLKKVEKETNERIESASTHYEIEIKRLQKELKNKNKKKFLGIF